MIAPLKDAKTYEDQVNNLKVNHGLEIADMAEAIDILSRVNYYRLSAYGIGLKRKDDSERYKDGISLRRLFRLYEFDHKLRLALFDILEQIETELRTKIAYHLAITYGPESYMDSSFFLPKYDSQHKHLLETKVINRFICEVKRNEHLPCVVHHQNKYGGHFPIWAAVELFSFGMLNSLYSLMLPQDKQAIAADYYTTPEYFDGWFLALVDVRNRCAHFGRIYNMPLPNTVKLYSGERVYSGNKIFPIIIILKRIMHERPAWETFYYTLSTLIKQYPEASLHFMGFPEKWQDVLQKVKPKIPKQSN